MSLSAKKVVITGGPGTGKTSIINKLKTKNINCFDEIIRELTLEAKKEVDTSSQVSNPIAFVNDPMDFNTKLLQGRIKQFNKANLVNKNVNFFDRGIPDVLAYMDFFNQEYDSYFVDACNKHKYNHVFLLPPWKEIYKVDNERFETFSESIDIYNSLTNIYTKFGYIITEVPFGTVEERTNFILNALKM